MKPLPVAGYTDQTGDKVALVNENKVLEEKVLRQLDAMKGNTDCDPRMVAIAFTKMQEAFMWMNRAVFQPKRIDLPEDRE